jgi:hypothetical protein
MVRLALHADDPYRRLRPPQATPYRELCDCRSAPPVKLMPLGSYNPVSCMVCNREVAPETIGFPEPVTDAIADWHALYSALDHLWLRGPEEYRARAAAELADVGSPANQLGLAVRARLDLYRRCYYWVFGYGPEGLEEVRQCPVCGESMAAYDGYRVEWWVCEPCGIVADASD